MSENKHRETITSILSSGLCTGCGTCAGVCPKAALMMEIDERDSVCVPRLLEDQCTKCGICLDVCPGDSMAKPELSIELRSREPNEALIGAYLACYLSYATDHEVRYQAASGGVVTAVLLFALQKGLIEGALLTRMSRERPLEPESFIARTREDILQATGSKYCPVPVNMALKEILEREGRYAVVGLPCQISGIRKAEAALPKLRGRIVLHLGLFCSHQVSFRGTRLLLDRLGVRSSEVARLSYRGRGWPGGITIELNDGRQRFVPNLPGSLWNTIFGGFFFVPAACLACGDVTSEQADISFGDAWLPEIIRKDRTGTSVLVARSGMAMELLKSAAGQGVIHLEPLPSADVVRSQIFFTHFKKVSREWRLANRNHPASSMKVATGVRVTLRQRLLTRIIVANSRVASSRPGMFAVRYAPHRILRAYVGALQSLYRAMMKGEPEEWVK